MSEIRNGVRRMVRMLEEYEWAEHISTDEDLQELEYCITRLIINMGKPTDLKAVAAVVHVPYEMGYMFDPGVPAHDALQWGALRPGQSGRELVFRDDAERLIAQAEAKPRMTTSKLRVTGVEPARSGDARNAEGTPTTGQGQMKESEQ